MARGFGEQQVGGGKIVVGLGLLRWSAWLWAFYKVSLRVFGDSYIFVSVNVCPVTSEGREEGLFPPI